METYQDLVVWQKAKELRSMRKINLNPAEELLTEVMKMLNTMISNRS